MNDHTNKKVVVTGGAGFIGSHLVRALLEKGYDVHVIDNYAGGKFPERHSQDATYHEGDITDAEFVKEVFSGAEIVFHLAALPRVQFSIQQPVETNFVNVHGTLVLLKAAHDAGVRRFIYSASSSAYGDQEQMPLKEHMEANPKSPYALQKYVGELYARLFAELYGLETVSLRYFNVYGAHADPDGPYALVVARFIKQKKAGEPMTIAGDGLNTRDYTHVRDIVRANILAAESPRVGKGEVINIGSGRNYSVLEVADLLGGERVHIEARLEPKNTLADTTRARELLGWEPKESFEEGVRELLKEAGL
jgi:UDP-glucose 4-epimerase